MTLLLSPLHLNFMYVLFKQSESELPAGFTNGRYQSSSNNLNSLANSWFQLDMKNYTMYELQCGKDY